MPWRSRYITSRRHPYAFAVYATLLALGALIAGNVLDSSLITAVVGVGWQDAWEVLLIGGGAIGLAGVLWPQQRLDDGLAVEMAGATACTFGLTVYSVAVIVALGWTSPGWVLFGLLAAGCTARAEQCRRDGRRLDLLAKELTVAKRRAAERDEKR